MNLKQAVEKNRRGLEIYCAISRLMGWLLMVGGLGSLVFTGWMLVMEEARVNSMLLPNPYCSVPEMKFIMLIRDPFLDLFLPGILALLVAQLLRFILDENALPGWLLRKGEAVLYFAAGIVFFSFMPPLWHLGVFLSKGDYAAAFILSFGGMSPNVLLVGAKLTILIGLGQVLRRVLPMIEESKALV